MSAADSVRWNDPECAQLAKLEAVYNGMFDALRFARRFQDSTLASDYELLDALATTALIRYRRCFSRGAGVPPNAIDDVSGITAFQKQVHSHLLDVRDKHVAHAVNQMETHDVYLWVVPDDAGTMRVTGVSRGSRTGIAMSIELAAEMEQLCMKWLNHINELTQSESLRLLPLAQRLSSAELAALPRGPREPDPKPRRGR
jgi:hypothetical protein